MVKVLVLALFLFFFRAAFAQVPETLPAFQELFSMFLKREFQEKVYLHTDKSHYVAGEYIWFRAYRTDAATHVPSVYSCYIYVELYNEREKLVKRIKVKEQENCFQGSFLLDPHLPSGRYCLRAYTYWMQNFDENFYFTKEIEIENIQAYRLRREIRWEQTGSDKNYAEIQFTDQEGQPFPMLFADCRCYRGIQQVRQHIVRADDKGWIRCPLRTKDSVSSLRIQFLDKKPFEYQLEVQVPDLKDTVEADIQFLPEGGHWVGGVVSRLGFKAIGKDGYGVNVYGSIYRLDGEWVCNFVSSHLGMGRVSLQPETGHRYYALVHLPGGRVKRVELPEVEEKGVVLQANIQDSILKYDCRIAGFPAEQDFYLLLHSRGRLWAVEKIDSVWNGHLNLKNLPAGILHGVIVDGNGLVYAERLSFVYPEKKIQVALSPDRKIYGRRDSVRIRLDLQGCDSLSCSVAVTDRLLAPQKQWGGNIVNYFLLTSDLKGTVEQPDWYFEDTISRRYRERMLDLLLSTQGWRRFDIGKVCRGEQNSLPFFLEMAQGFSGKVKNFWGKDAAWGKLLVVAPRIGLLQKLDTDEQGQFHLELNYPDSTVFIFQAMTARNSKWVDLELKEDSLRLPYMQLLKKQRISENRALRTDTVETEDFRSVKTLGYYYERGRKIYRLEEVGVVGKSAWYEGLTDQLLEVHDLKEEKFRTVLDWVKSIPGIDIVPDEYFRIIESSTGNIHFILEGKEANQLRNANNPRDNTVMDMVTVFENVDIESVKRVGYMKNEQDIHLIVELKEGVGFLDGFSNAGFVRYQPLGYHIPAEFYQPRYHIEQERNHPEPDERSTLYWNPRIVLSASAETTIQFYTTDRQGPFRMVLEGVTPEGEVVRKEMLINTGSLFEK